VGRQGHKEIGALQQAQDCDDQPDLGEQFQAPTHRVDIMMTLRRRAPPVRRRRHDVGLIGDRSFLWIGGLAWRCALGGDDGQGCDCVAGRAKLHLDAGELPYDALVARPLSDAFCLVATAVAGLTIRTVVAMIAVAVRPPVEPSIVTTRGARPQRAVSSLI